MTNILIVEDDDSLSRGITLALRQPEYQFFPCDCLSKARAALRTRPFDLILLDVGLPDGSGLSFCQEIREHFPGPILLITANDMEYDEIAGLEAGADDYITKPFSLAVLRARVGAALRRSQASNDAQGAFCIQIDNMIFDFDRMRFYKDGAPLNLSRTEQRLLRLLVENRGQTLSREQLLDKVWDGGEFVDENALSVAIRRLRGKLEKNPKSPVYIQTVYGTGYTWNDGQGR